MNPANFYISDPWLKPFTGIIDKRIGKCLSKEKHLIGNGPCVILQWGIIIMDFTGTTMAGYSGNGHQMQTVFFLSGIFTGWKEKQEFMMKRINPHGDWEITLPLNALKHGDLYKLSVHWEGGKGERIPSYANRVVQDDKTKIFSAQVWHPEEQYKWKIEDFKPPDTAPVIYEAHIGMATAAEKTGTYREFTENVLPVIIKAGYNTIQLMAIQEHPFYGSFGYHVSSFFAASSRFGTPEELKELIDKAHMAGLRVIMDLVHSHSVKNVNEGLGLFDGSPGQYFHPNERRNHSSMGFIMFRLWKG